MASLLYCSAKFRFPASSSATASCTDATALDTCVGATTVRVLTNSNWSLLNHFIGKIFLSMDDKTFNFNHVRYLKKNSNKKNWLWNSTCWAMLSLITMFPIWSSSCASEVMVVVAVATFSTLRLHMRRSNSQSASPSLPHCASRKPVGGARGCTPNSSLTRHESSGYLSITRGTISIALWVSSYRSWARKTPITLAMFMSMSTGNSMSVP